MAGKKQHYIPKALLRGFQANAKGPYGQAFVWKSGREPYLASIGDIAAERYFYSDIGPDGSTTLDDRITDYENRLAPLLRNLQGATEAPYADPLVAAEVVAHLSVRGAYLRELFSSGVHQLMQTASVRLSDVEAARNLLGIDDQDLSSPLVNGVDREVQNLKEHLPSRFPTPLLRQILLYFARENFSALHESSLTPLSIAFNQLKSFIPDAIRSGHAKTLDSGMAPDRRVAELSRLSWRVYRRSTELILPDCVALSIGRSGQAQPYLLGSVAEGEIVLLPIASDKLLVGGMPERHDNPLNVDFNYHAAGCCTTFFISSDDSTIIREVSKRIGGIHATVGAIATEALNERERHIASPAVPSGDQASIDNQRVTASPSLSPPSTCLSYYVSFKDCATQEQAQEIAKAVGIVVNELTSFLDFDELEGIVFAEDYTGALQELDLQLSTPASHETTRVEGLIGVATRVTAVRDGSHKSIILMRSWLGHAMISGNDEATRTAAHMLGMMLAQVAFSGLLTVAFGEPKTRPSYSALESILFRPMDGAPAGYYSAWMGSELDPAAADMYREVVLRTFAYANALVEAERQAYASHGKLDCFLESVTSVLGDFLVALAKLIGHCDARNESIYGEGDDLIAALRNHGLYDWISLYARDLRRVFASRGRWGSIRALSSLGTHMERQLWRFSIFPWVSDDGVIRVEVLHPSPSAP